MKWRKEPQPDPLDAVMEHEARQRREYDQMIARSKAVAEAEYEALRPQIEHERALLAMAARSNERTWFCPVADCKVIIRREFAPVCSRHDRRMSPLPKVTNL